MSKTKHTEYTEGKLTSWMREIRHKDRGIIIANIYPHLEDNMSLSEQIANAERLVKCWNMHQDLIDTLKECVKEIRWTTDILRSNEYPSTISGMKKLLKKSDELIKQSEQ